MIERSRDEPEQFAALFDRYAGAFAGILVHPRAQHAPGTGGAGRLAPGERQFPTHRSPSPSVMLSSDQRPSRERVTHSTHTLTHETRTGQDTDR